MEVAREEMSSYKNHLEGRGTKPALDLTVSVLSSSAWPSYPVIEVEVPARVQAATRDFEQYYKSNNSGRRLEWKHQLAHCQMKANFPKGRKEIVFSSFQAVVMLYFNDKADGEAVTYTELKAATRLTDEDLKRTLQSLACAKYRVLTKIPKGRDVNLTEKFLVNLEFSDPKTRIKINQIQLKETKQENKETHEHVAQDRKYEAQATIVRIMKSEKKIKHALLVAEVIKSMKNRGSIDADEIKQQIDR